MFGRTEELAKLKAELKDAFGRIKEELDEHLVAINDNTAEQQANYEYLERLEAKIEKLNERFEELHLMIDKLPKPEEEHEIRLTRREKEVFQVLYSAGTEEKLLRYKDIAKKLDISELLVRNYITNLIEKSVPIVKKYIDKEAHLAIEKEFRELQATKGIVKLEKPNIDMH